MIPPEATPHPIHTNYLVTPTGEVYSQRKGRALIQFDMTPKLNYQCVGGSFGKTSNGTTKVKYLVHRLVAETYIPNPHNYSEVNHINGDKTDNSVSNLEWTSHRQNMHHSNNTLHATKRYNYKVMVMSTGEIFETDSVWLWAKAFGIPHQPLTQSVRYHRTSKPIKVVDKTPRA